MGSIPILGKLFSSTNYQNNKTELVIIVTPYLVEPTDPVQAAHAARIAGFAEQRRRIQLQASDRRRRRRAGQPRLVGAAGYVY